MGFDEWIFAKTYKLFHKTKQDTRPHCAYLSTIQRPLEIGFQAISAVPSNIQEAKEFVGFYKSTLFLPAKLDILPTQQQNMSLYWFITFFHAKALHAPVFNTQKLTDDVLQEFIGLRSLFLSLTQEHLVSLEKHLTFQPVIEAKSHPTKPTANYNTNDQANTQSFTLEKKGPNVAELKDLDESQENPLIHMFEKVNTAETYQGGNKSKEAEQSLEDMSEALQEVDLKTAIRSNERTPGLIKTDSIVESGSELHTSEETHFDLKYPEWDDQKKTYRPDWCSVKVISSTENHHTLEKTPAGQMIKNRFESCFNHYLWQGRQMEGPELDLPSVIDNSVTRKIGGRINERLFMKRIQQQKDFQILLLMDESFSTESFLGKQSVLEMITQSIFDLSQAFENAPEQLAILSFFSETRLHCCIKTIKDFSESISTGQARLKRSKSQGYTRIGVALRHANFVLKNQKSRRKCLVLFTDAKPTDLDRYEGKYGVADIRKCVDELHGDGIELIVLSFSDAKDERFAQMFGQKMDIHHRSTQKSMTQSLIKIVENIAMAP